MKKPAILKHEFVEFIPENIPDGVLFISLKFATVAHTCGCGCGKEVITPLSPTDWQLTFDGETITLYPSIGNWNFPCKSHYWIQNSKIKWAELWAEHELHGDKDILKKMGLFAKKTTKRIAKKATKKRHKA